MFDKASATRSVKTFEAENLSILESEIENLCKEGKSPTLFILSHNIDPDGLLTGLIRFKDRLSVVISVNGDMTIEIERWKKLDSVLKGWRCKLLCASEASKRQVQALIKAKDICEVLPNPISAQYFKDVELPKEKPGQFVYAGRVSFGKNILQLMSQFHRVQQIHPEHTLDIYGGFDSIGYLFHGLRPHEDSLKREFFKLIDMSKGKIRYHGEIAPEKLAQKLVLYKYLISASLYHDEDFGLIVPQAMACGVTPIITNWGGYRDHPLSSFIPVEKPVNTLPTIKDSSLRKGIIFAEQVEPDKIRKACLERYHPAKIAHLLNEILNLPWYTYQGQSEAFFQYAKLYKSRNGIPFDARITCSSSQALYQKIYEGYYA